MRLSEIIRLVWLNLSQNKFKVVLTSVGIIVGSATIMLVLAIGTGSREEVAEQFKNLNAGAIDVTYGGEAQSGGGSDWFSSMFSFGGGEMPSFGGDGGSGMPSFGGGMPSFGGGSGGMPSFGGSSGGGMPSFGGGSGSGRSSGGSRSSSGGSSFSSSSGGASFCSDHTRRISTSSVSSPQPTPMTKKI